MLVIALGICWNVSVRYKSSQRELSKVMKDMEGLAKAERELQDLQVKCILLFPIGQHLTEISLFLSECNGEK